LIIGLISGIFHLYVTTQAMKSRTLALLALLFFFVTLSSCGNKGDLYMPDKKSDDKQQTQ